MPIQIEEFDVQTASDESLRELWEYYKEVFAERTPNDPPERFERTVADWRVQYPEYEVKRWILRHDGVMEAVSIAYIGFAENLEEGFTRIHVTAPRRGSGHARRLAPIIFDWLQDNGRSRLSTWVVEGGQFDSFLTRLGLKEAYHDQRSRLNLAELDRDLIRSWIERARERATDYELVELASPIPDDDLARYCEILFQMNTAPKEDLERDDETMTPERWRSVEQGNIQAGYEFHTLVAVHRPTGQFVGSSTVTADRLDPQQGWQWETVVHPDHRQRGLGRWLKAAMIEVVEAAHPEMARIDTTNSVTNDAMLGINLAMGFRPISRDVIWQGDLATARERWGV